MKITPLKGLKFLIRAIRLRLGLTPIDRMAPLAGELASQGFVEHSISEGCVEQLNNLFHISDSTEVLQGNISLRDIDYHAIDEIFRMIHSNITD